MVVCLAVPLTFSSRVKCGVSAARDEDCRNSRFGRKAAFALPGATSAGRRATPPGESARRRRSPPRSSRPRAPARAHHIRANAGGIRFARAHRLRALPEGNDDDRPVLVVDQKTVPFMPSSVRTRSAAPSSSLERLLGRVGRGSSYRVNRANNCSYLRVANWIARAYRIAAPCARDQFRTTQGRRPREGGELPLWTRSGYFRSDHSATTR